MQLIKSIQLAKYISLIMESKVDRNNLTSLLRNKILKWVNNERKVLWVYTIECKSEKVSSNFMYTDSEYTIMKSS